MRQRRPRGCQQTFPVTSPDPRQHDSKTRRRQAIQSRPQCENGDRACTSTSIAREGQHRVGAAPWHEGGSGPGGGGPGPVSIYPHFPAQITRIPWGEHPPPPDQEPQPLEKGISKYENCVSRDRKFGPSPVPLTVPRLVPSLRNCWNATL